VERQLSGERSGPIWLGVLDFGLKLKLDTLFGRRNIIDLVTETTN
jgi:hypothetical protein